MRYVCIEEFELPNYDEDGFESGDYFIVEKGTIFEKSSESIIGGEVHLESDKEWIEITSDSLKKYFSEIEEILLHDSYV